MRETSRSEVVKRKWRTVIVTIMSQIDHKTLKRNGSVITTNFDRKRKKKCSPMKYWLSTSTACPPN